MWLLTHQLVVAEQQRTALLHDRGYLIDDDTDLLLRAIGSPHLDDMTQRTDVSAPALLRTHAHRCPTSELRSDRLLEREVDIRIIEAFALACSEVELLKLCD